MLTAWVKNSRRVMYDSEVGMLLQTSTCEVCSAPISMTLVLIADVVIASHGETPVVCYPNARDGRWMAYAHCIAEAQS